MTSTVAYPSDQDATKPAVLEWLAKNAQDAKLVTLSAEQFTAVESSMTANERFVATNKQAPSDRHVGLAYEGDTSLAYWVTQ